jgi:hypothetical protein
LLERIGQSFTIRKLVKILVDAMLTTRTGNIEEATEIRIVNFDTTGGGKLGKGQIGGAEVIKTPGRAELVLVNRSRSAPSAREKAISEITSARCGAFRPALWVSSRIKSVSL